MYYIIWECQSGLSLLIESTDSMIIATSKPDAFCREGTVHWSTWCRDFSGSAPTLSSLAALLACRWDESVCEAWGLSHGGRSTLRKRPCQACCACPLSTCRKRTLCALLLMQTPQDLNQEERVLLTDALSIQTKQLCLWCNFSRTLQCWNHAIN